MGYFYTNIYTAFKNHQQTKEIAAALWDENGHLKPFSKFRKEALKISEDYNIKWLQTEYNTAVRSARTAANLKKYEETAHLYPNLEYIHTTSAHPRESHLQYVGTILPIGHPWWDQHIPPSGWNCACTVRQTDKASTGVPDGEYVDPVFRNNPVKTEEFVNIKETAYYNHTNEDVREEVANWGLRLLQTSIDEKKETYVGKKGGFLEIVQQNGNERANNLNTYKYMADRGGKYSLLKEIDVPEMKNPDAFNHEKGWFSDAKHPTSSNGKNAIQASIRKASVQDVEEVVIWLSQDYPSSALHEGLRAGLQKGRGGKLQEIILIRHKKEPIYLNVSKLREKLFKK